MLQKPKFVYFDVGNIFLTFARVFSTLKKDFCLGDDFEKSYQKYDSDATIGKTTIPEVWQSLCQEYKITSGRDYGIIKSWVSDYQVISETHQLAIQLSNKYALGILSNLYLDFWPEIVGQKFVPNVKFSSVIISAEVGCQKPYPAIYKIAEEKCGFKGSEIIFVDDKPENLTTALSFGWQTFLFDYQNPEKSCDELAKILL